MVRGWDVVQSGLAPVECAKGRGSSSGGLSEPSQSSAALLYLNCVASNNKTVLVHVPFLCAIVLCIVCWGCGRLRRRVMNK